MAGGYIGHSGSDTVFDLVKAHLADVPDAIECTSYYPEAPTVAVANFSGLIDIGLPDLDNYYYIDTPLDGTISATIATPHYSGSYEDISVIALDSLVSAIDEAYTLPPTLPTDEAQDPDLAYPVAGFKSVPTSAGLTTQTAPTISIGVIPDFLDIPSVSYDLSDLDTLDETLPSAPTLPDLDLLESPTKLSHTISSNLEAEILNAFSGVVVLSGEAQEIMLARAHYEFDLGIDRKERELFRAEAAGGHYDVNGGLLGRVADLKHDASFKDREIYEKIREDVSKRALARMTEAVASALTIESANLAMHLDYAAKLVETLRFNVSAQVQYANLLVELFNSSLKGGRQLISAYQEYAKTVIAEYQAKVVAEESKTAVLDTNRAKLDSREAQLGTKEAQIGVYSDEIRQAVLPLQEYQVYVSGVMKNVDVARVNVNSLKEAIKAFEDAISVSTARIEASASEIRATGSATGVYEANWNAYNEAHSVAETLYKTQRAWYGSSLEALQAEIGNLQAASQAQRSKLRALTEWTQANQTLAGQHERTFGAVADYTKQFNRSAIAYQEADASIDLAQKDVLVRVDALEAQAQAIQESINLGLLSAQTQTAAGCSQAANSMKSIAAGMRGTASADQSGSSSASATASESTSKAYIYRKTRTISA
jgi:hypothetical protein